MDSTNGEPPIAFLLCTSWTTEAGHASANHSLQAWRKHDAEFPVVAKCLLFGVHSIIPDSRFQLISVGSFGVAKYTSQFPPHFNHNIWLSIHQ